MVYSLLLLYLKTYQLIFNLIPYKEEIVINEFKNLSVDIQLDVIFLDNTERLYLKTYQLIFNCFSKISSKSSILFKNLSVDIQWS